jgi:hypothetical protein
MELLGLAIVVVIVLLGIMLVLRFFFFNVQENPVAGPQDTQLGANFLDTLLETTMVCRDVPLSVLLKDCAEGGSMTCDAITSGTTTIGGGDSCQTANATIQYLLNSTLGKWGRKYEFFIQDSTPLAIIKASNPPQGCEAGYQPITRPRPIGQSTITLVLKLCQ